MRIKDVLMVAVIVDRVRMPSDPRARIYRLGKNASKLSFRAERGISL
jgi:hypothetical protein